MMRRTPVMVAIGLLGMSGCSGTEDEAPPTAQVLCPTPTGTECDGVSGPCLVDQGSTMMEDVRTRAGGLPNYMADVLREELAAFSGETIDVAFINGGAIRGGANLGPPDFDWSSETARVGNPYCAGPLTREQILGWFPFQDDHVVFTLTGEQIKRSLEHGVATFADDAGTTSGADLLSGDGAGPFLHPSGLSFEATCPGTTRLKIGPADCDPFEGTCEYLNADVADTVTKMTIGGTVVFDAANGGWQDGADQQEFRVATNSFLAEGNDNHLDFKDGTNPTVIAIDDWNYVEELAERVAADSPLELGGDQGRITVVGEVDGLACNLPASCTPAHKAEHPRCQHLP